MRAAATRSLPSSIRAAPAAEHLHGWNPGRRRQRHHDRSGGECLRNGIQQGHLGTPINPFTLDNYADVFLARLSADGTRIWHTFQNKYSGLSSYGRKVAVALSGEIYVGGYASIGVTTWGFVRKFTAGGAYVQMYELARPPRR